MRHRRSRKGNRPWVSRHLPSAQQINANIKLIPDVSLITRIRLSFKYPFLSVWCFWRYLRSLASI